LKTALMVMGLPASGKTHYLNQLEGYTLYDDVQFDIENEKSETIAVTHPEFCDDRIRLYVKHRLIDAGFTVREVYFKNDATQCLENAKTRQNKKVNGYIKELSGIYSTPLNAIDVWKEST